MMTKTDLIKIIAEEENLETKVVEKIINKAAAVIIQKVAEGETVEIKNFGKFLAKDRAERSGINPRTGQPIIIEAHKVPYFKAGKKFKDAVNK